jgi:serine/threonine protein kinase
MYAASETWPLDALPRGTALHGLEIDAVLGRDGFGITYRVHDRVGQIFAIKECFPRQFAVRQGLQVLPADTRDAESLKECLDSFAHEAKSLVGLSQLGAAGDAVVKAMTFFESYGTAYLVREFVDGISLEALLLDDPSGLAPADLDTILHRLLHALVSVHDVGLLHCDIEPINVLLREDRHPVLLDCGAMRTGAGQGRATGSAAQVRTETYAPIEQLIGGKLGPYSDLYALGMTCYRAIGGTPIGAFVRQQSVLARKPDPLLPAVKIGAGRYPERLLAAIDWALAPSPDDRPPTATALLARLADEEGPIVTSAAATFRRDASSDRSAADRGAAGARGGAPATSPAPRTPPRLPLPDDPVSEPQTVRISRSRPVVPPSVREAPIAAASARAGSSAARVAMPVRPPPPPKAPARPNPIAPAPMAPDAAVPMRPAVPAPGARVGGAVASAPAPTGAPMAVARSAPAAVPAASAPAAAAPARSIPVPSSPAQSVSALPEPAPARALYSSLVEATPEPPLRPKPAGPGWLGTGVTVVVLLAALGGGAYWLWPNLAAPPAPSHVTVNAPAPAASVSALKAQNGVIELFHRIDRSQQDVADKLSAARRAAEQATTAAVSAKSETERATLQAGERDAEDQASFASDAARIARQAVFESTNLREAKADADRGETALLEGKTDDAMRDFASAEATATHLLGLLDQLDPALRSDLAIKQNRDKIARTLSAQGLDPQAYLAGANDLIARGEAALGQGRPDDAKRQFDDASVALLHDSEAVLAQQIADQAKIFDAKMAAGDLDGAQAALTQAKKLKQALSKVE